MTFHVNVAGAWKSVEEIHVKVDGVWKKADAMYYNDIPKSTLANGGKTWGQVWQDPGIGSGPRIVGPRLGQVYTAQNPFSIPGVDLNGYPSAPIIYRPVVPSYGVEGDTSQIASAKVTLTFLPVAPKSPTEHTISWEAPVGWGLYMVFWVGDDPASPGTAKSFFYYAAMTDAEAAAFSEPGKNIMAMWTPRGGGQFVYMPVCWDESGVTVPMRSDADGGLDPYSGYTPFPPTRSATSALADYTVANGYTDMARPFLGSPPVFSSVLIELKNSGGTVLDSWSGSLPLGNNWLDQDFPKPYNFIVEEPLRSPLLWQYGGYGYAGPQMTPIAVPGGMEFTWNPTPTADPQGNALQGVNQTTEEGGEHSLTLKVNAPSGAARWRPAAAFQNSGPWHTPDGTEQTETVLWTNPAASGITSIHFGIEVEAGDWPNAGIHTVTEYTYAYTPPPAMAMLSRRRDDPRFPEKDLYWPMEWQGLFDQVPTLGSDFVIRFGRETPHGIGEWDVYTKDGDKIGDFRLAMRYGWPDIIEIHGVNLQPDLVGKQIMRTIVRHGVEFCPVRYVVVKPPDQATFDVMRTWGWRTWDEGSTALQAATWLTQVPHEIPQMLGMESPPQQNVFSTLGLPPAEDVVRHV